MKRQGVICVSCELQIHFWWVEKNHNVESCRKKVLFVRKKTNKKKIQTTTTKDVVTRYQPDSFRYLSRRVWNRKLYFPRRIPHLELQFLQFSPQFTQRKKSLIVARSYLFKLHKVNTYMIHPATQRVNSASENKTHWPGRTHGQTLCVFWTQLEIRILAKHSGQHDVPCTLMCEYINGKQHTPTWKSMLSIVDMLVSSVIILNKTDTWDLWRQSVSWKMSARDRVTLLFLSLETLNL